MTSKKLNMLILITALLSSVFFLGAEAFRLNQFANNSDITEGKLSSQYESGNIAAKTGVKVKSVYQYNVKDSTFYYETTGGKRESAPKTIKLAYDKNNPANSKHITAGSSLVLERNELLMWAILILVLGSGVLFTYNRFSNAK